MRTYQWSSLPDEEIRRGVVRRAFATPHLMIVHHDLHPGMETRPHSHPFEQVVCVLEGEVVFTVDSVAHVTPAGTVFCIPAGATHFAAVPGNQIARTLDIFAPPRSDYAHLTRYLTED